jgi:dolichol-phosphate mannosyltransferase
VDETLVKKDLTIIIPTYNEAENIGFLLRDINENLDKWGIGANIVVVDDDSPDGTHDVVRRVAKTCSNIFLVIRKTNKGLSPAVVQGFQHADTDYIIVMDGDGQHPTTLIPQLYYSLKRGSDVAIGTRIDTPGWSFKRRVISWGASTLAKMIFPRVKDPMSGFFGVRRGVIDAVVLEPQGYKILIEVLGKGKYKTITELPYVFQRRNNGLSKLRFLQIYQYLQHLIKVSISGVLDRKSPVHDEVMRVVRFGVVGASGIVVNLVILYSIIRFTQTPEIIAAGIAVETSILTNFILNDVWTFKDIRTIPIYKRLGRFQVVSIAGMAINLVVFTALTLVGVWYILAEVVGIIFAFIFNFIVNRLKTWAV